MKIYLSCTANLGDFSNGLPIVSGIVNSYGKVDFVIRSEMRKFSGIKEFLLYQDLFTDVNFDDEVMIYGQYINLSSWTREDKNDPNRPIETCRYENWIKDNYNLDFKVDDSFTIKVKDLDIDCFSDKTIIGDRWSQKQDPNIDMRRFTNVVENGAKPDPSKVVYLDYSKDLMHNCYIIKNNPNKFVTTFTGIGIVADLMNKETVVCWDEDMRVWDGRSVEFDFERHYYLDRKSKLVHVKELEI
jgi:hypothetical protein